MLHNTGMSPRRSRLRRRAAALDVWPLAAWHAHCPLLRPSYPREMSKCRFFLVGFLFFNLCQPSVVKLYTLFPGSCILKIFYQGCTILPFFVLKILLNKRCLSQLFSPFTRITNKKTRQLPTRTCMLSAIILVLDP